MSIRPISLETNGGGVNRSSSPLQIVNSTNNSNNNNEQPTTTISSFNQKHHQRSSSTNSNANTINNNTSSVWEKEREKDRQQLENIIRFYSLNPIESWMAINHLFDNLSSAAIIDFLCSKLYMIEDKDIDFYITQLCILLINQSNDQKATLSSLAKFVMDRCAKSMRFAIKSYWIFQAFEEDGQKNLFNIETYTQQSTPTPPPPSQQQQQYLSTSPKSGLTNPALLSTSPTSSTNGASVLQKTINDEVDHREQTTEQLNGNIKDKQDNVNNNNNNGYTDTINIGITKIYINGDEVLVDSNNNNNNNVNGGGVIKPPLSSYELIEARKELATRLREYCEMSVITCSRPLITRPRTSSLPSPHLGYSMPNLPPPPTPTEPLSEETTVTTTCIQTGITTTSNITTNVNNTTTNQSNQNHHQSNQQLPAHLQPPPAHSLTPPIESTQPDYDFEFEISKSYRCDYLNSILLFVQTLSNISKKLLTVPIDLRQAKLKDEISILNINLPLGLYLPLWQNSKHHCIVRIPPEEVKILNSRERVPFLLVLEMIEGEEEASAANILNIVSSYLPFTINNKQNQNYLKLDLIKKHIKKSSGNGSNEKTDIIIPPIPLPAPPPPPIDTKLTKEIVDREREKIFNEKLSPFGELWEEKMERYRKISPYGHLPNWRMASVIIKTGDDCRQEQMAVQLIRKFQEIWRDAKLPLFLRPYSILVTSSQSGIIETIPDTVSLHNLKKSSPNYTSLLAYFKSTYGEPQSEPFRTAQAKFVESLAAYSIVTYLLQVKDRHNGNILLDKEGHIIHIDFGFILTNSPGNISFESAPFKLIQDWIDVIGGTAQSPMFLYFQALCVRGFLEARKHCDKFVSFIELMMAGPRMSCFQGGRDCIEQLKQRFFLQMSERECGNHVEQLITYSLDHRATRYYDYYQYYYNNIYG